MKKLLVLANEFPYGSWEPYMETEEMFYSIFNKVWIASLQLRKEHTKTKRTVNSSAAIIPVLYKSRFFYLLNSLTVLFDKELYKEVLKLKKYRCLSMGRIIDLFVFLSRAHHEARVIDNALKKENKDTLLIYSYRFEYQPYVAILLKRKWKLKGSIVCRAHGYDIYEERHKNNYIPLRDCIMNNVDYIFPCSKYGVDYLKKYGIVKAHIFCKYLGTVDCGERQIKTEMKPLRIVSCSTVVKVKRLEKIVNVLSMLKDIEIEWTHFGDGPMLNEIKTLVSEKLENNVKVLFPGNVANSKILHEYSTNDYHLFLNLSSSEGLPVSIMEAMSFGIPCIATNVGGTREIVNDENGFLINVDADDDVIAEIIRHVLQLDLNEYIALRRRARDSWSSKFNSKINYTEFIKSLSNLC